MFKELLSKKIKLGHLFVIPGTYEVVICMEEPCRVLFSSRYKEGIGKFEKIGTLTNKQSKIFERVFKRNEIL
jgi:hypothetical protein